MKSKEYEVWYKGTYNTGDNESWNIIKCDTAEQARATYNGMIESGFPIDDIYMINEKEAC